MLGQYVASYENRAQQGMWLGPSLKPVQSQDAAVLRMECSDHLPPQLDAVGVRSKRDAVMWLWRAHNHVNELVRQMSEGAKNDGYTCVHILRRVAHRAHCCCRRRGWLASPKVVGRAIELHCNPFGACMLRLGWCGQVR